MPSENGSSYVVISGNSSVIPVTLPGKHELPNYFYKNRTPVIVIGLQKVVDNKFVVTLRGEIRPPVGAGENFFRTPSGLLK